MIIQNEIKGIVFDYGGTLDTNGRHWSEVLWDAYVDNNVPVDKDTFKNAYVYAERYLATNYVIKPEYNFKQLLIEKTRIQISWLIENGFLPDNDKTSTYSLAISNQCYNFVTSTLQISRPIVEKLSEKYPLVLVSNFYGNVEAVLKDFDLIHYFKKIIESAIVGVRKPDPAIFSLGVEALSMNPGEVVVIGDSYSKDIFPANQIGCKTIWLKGSTWGDEETGDDAGLIISDFAQLHDIFNL